MCGGFSLGSFPRCRLGYMWGLFPRWCLIIFGPDGTITVGSFTLVHSCHEREQGFNIRMTGPQSRPLFDMDGLLLTSRVPQDDEPELDEEDTKDAA